TTNPSVSTGDGIAMAFRAGAAVADVEFMQFHPTALDVDLMPRPLLSEALRGDGAILRDERGEAFMVGEHPLADLAPRDVVARAITRRLAARHLRHLFLDVTPIAGFDDRFPTVSRAVRAAGLDPARDLLPVAPAAHYLSGGVCTDLDGATTLPGLWACGEVACSGVHGANRLASNSLLDGLVFAPRAVDALLDGRRGPRETGVLRGLLGALPPLGPVADGDGGTVERVELQRLMTEGAGVLRDAASLSALLDRLPVGPVAADPAAHEVRNLVAVARTLVAAALARTESRGTHTRLDHPEPSDALLGRFVQVRGADPTFIPLPVAVEAP
ncbi:MAG: FAD-binding protein, partial [Actinomycetes bacterium]